MKVDLFNKDSRLDLVIFFTKNPNLKKKIKTLGRGGGGGGAEKGWH